MFHEMQLYERVKLWLDEIYWHHRNTVMLIYLIILPAAFAHRKNNKNLLKLNCRQAVAVHKTLLHWHNRDNQAAQLV